MRRDQVRLQGFRVSKVSSFGIELTTKGTKEHEGLARAAPIEDHFAAVARAHGFEAFLEFPIRKVVSDDGRNVEPAFEHDRHFVPGLIHFAAIDAFYGEHAENDLRP